MIITYTDIYEESVSLLHGIYGDSAVFRDGQYEAIEAAATRRRTLVVQRTGWGKSLVYFICTKLFQERGRGMTMVVSPLLVLMDNQMEMARGLGIRCDVLNSTVKDRREEILRRLSNGELDLIFVTPETLFKEDMQSLLPKLRIALFVIDEAHCISDWGHDFRLEYGNLGKVVAGLPANVSVLATTATANNRVINDLKRQLGEDVFISRGPLSRDSLHIQVMHCGSRADRYAWILDNIGRLPGTGIIYCLTRRDCDYLSDFLRKNGVSVLPYYSGEKNGEANAAAIEAFRKNEIKAIVATVKLGMGYDKGDVSFIIHYQMPSNIVLYYQQVGRAGRNLPDAYVFLLCGQEDRNINEYFINTAFPSQQEAESVYQAVGAKDDVKLWQLEGMVNIRKNRVMKTLDFLQNEGAVRKEKTSYYITPKRYQYPAEHYQAVTEIRRREMAQMMEFTKTTQCLSQFAVNCLDDFTASPCGKCANCLHRDIFPGLSLSFESQRKASDYINSRILEILPRKKWPDYKKIPCPNQTGCCLSKYGDPGYGALVKEGKYGSEQRFCDELVGRSAKLLSEIAKKHGVQALTCVPSLRNHLVRDFAMRVAQSAGLSFLDLLRKTPAPPQKNMENSAYQHRNALESFSVLPKEVPKKLILIDDIVDSRWTLTVCGHLLCERGCQEVFPFALADSSQEEDT